MSPSYDPSWPINIEDSSLPCHLSKSMVDEKGECQDSHKERVCCVLLSCNKASVLYVLVSQFLSTQGISCDIVGWLCHPGSQRVWTSSQEGSASRKLDSSVGRLCYTEARKWLYRRKDTKQLEIEKTNRLQSELVCLRCRSSAQWVE